ncbi:unnamed protein product [Discosporangium mesarthrocarpum]
MTTAHRPTWVAAQSAASDLGNWSTGGQASRSVSARSLPGQTKLKVRQSGQNSEADIRRRDVRAFLEDNEQRAREDKALGKGRRYDEGAAGRNNRDRLQLLLKEQGEVDLEKVNKYDDADDADSGDDLDSSDSDDDSDDDEEALEKELEKIAKEREVARKLKEQEEAAAEEKRKQEAAMTGNILLTHNASSQVKRRWNDDVVFKGQARTEPEQKKRFVNDTIRNDFHRRFLTKYIK